MISFVFSSWITTNEVFKWNAICMPTLFQLKQKLYCALKVQMDVHFHIRIPVCLRRTYLMQSNEKQHRPRYLFPTIEKSMTFKLEYKE